MKKAVAVLMIIVILSTASGCTNETTEPTVQPTVPLATVPQPMAYPDYTFDVTPDTMQLRMTAVQAMRDILSIQWCTQKEFKFKNNGENHKTVFVHKPGETYGGLLYATASTGIFQFFEYYNPENGCLEYEGTADELKLELGGTCADAVLWGWSTVCNSISGPFYPAHMVPRNGYIPVGDYTINEHMQTYLLYPTYAIIKANAKEVIMDAYAKTLPADAVVSSSDDHAMMIIEAPTVKYLQDGSIDENNSYVMVQDQRAGGDEDVIDGVKISYKGRLRAKYTFARLYKDNYIPLTCAEFAGTKPYDNASITVNKSDCTSISDLSSATILSNYPLAVVNIISIDSSGNQTVLSRNLFGNTTISGAPRSFNLSKAKNLSTLSPAPNSVIKVEVVLSTGERFYPIEFTA